MGKFVAEKARTLVCLGESFSFVSLWDIIVQWVDTEKKIGIWLLYYGNVVGCVYPMISDRHEKIA